MGRRQQRKARNRAALIRAGMQLFKANGFSQTTVEQITERADVGKGTFYNHFTRKEELLVAGMMAEQAELAEKEWSTIFALPTVRARLHHLCTWGAAWVANHPELSVVWCHERCRNVGDGPSGFDTLLFSIIRAGQAAGELRAARRPEHLSLEVTALFVMHIFAWSAAGCTTDLAQALREAVDTYLSGALVKGD